MNKLIITLVAALFVMPTFAAGSKSCKDFKTQAEAQAYYVKNKAKKLDRDGDGRACDCLPGGNGKNCPKSKK